MQFGETFPVSPFFRRKLLKIKSNVTFLTDASHPGFVFPLHGTVMVLPIVTTLPTKKIAAK